VAQLDRKAPHENAGTITLSKPKASSTRLPAVTTAPIAATASTVIHPIANHSSLASRRSRCCSGRYIAALSHAADKAPRAGREWHVGDFGRCLTLIRDAAHNGSEATKPTLRPIPEVGQLDCCAALGLSSQRAIRRAKCGASALKELVRKSSPDWH
jgi:hypothetical protein